LLSSTADIERIYYFLVLLMLLLLV
jgi:hypothetical protein